MKTNLAVIAGALFACLATTVAGAGPRRPPNPDKLAAGGHPVDPGAPAARAAALEARRPEPYPVNLRVLDAGGAETRELVTAAGEQLPLQLEITNLGGAGHLGLRGTTWAMDVLLPASVSVAPGQTVRVPVRLVKRDCARKASFFQVYVRPLGIADARAFTSASTRLSVRCR